MCKCNAKFTKKRMNMPIMKEGHTIVMLANVIKCKKCKRITITEVERARLIKAVDGEYNKLLLTGKIKSIFEEVIE